MHSSFKDSRMTQTLSVDQLDEDKERKIEIEMPFYKKISFLDANASDSPYANFKSVCIREGILAELTIMMQSTKAVSTVNNSIKLAKFFVSPSEIEILLRELENLPIF